MANLSLRMLYFCLFAAVLINGSNYIFMRIFYPGGKRISNYYYPKTESGMATDRSLLYSEVWFRGFRSNFNNEMISTIDHHEVLHNKTLNATELHDVMVEVSRCPVLPPGLGEIDIHSNLLDEKQSDVKHSNVKVGGVYQPPTCKARQSAAVIIAYRGCRKYLTTFLLFLHPLLIKQQLDYQIFVVEQSNNSQHFNRGMLLNVGFAEAQKRRKNGWDCIIFHEAHIVPTDSRNLYRCSWYPRQLAAHVERRVLGSYVPKFGGAVAMTPEQYSKVNGFSNKYWGNDADFEDLYNRVINANYFIETTLPVLGKYKTLEKHTGAVRVKSEYIATVSPLYLLDGLTSLSYKVELFQAKRLYTELKVNISETSDTESYKQYHDKILNTSSTQTIQIKATTTAST
ncbi:unnamed protein product [Arctia plantaginis]|uniref:Beta-1,4-N-acetylgalactosaminyltransferase n=1 Tax=Arctia plantaginis TaxID=874455 RepID=A0A8S1B1A7_ARCPL|nr:unnamed protein product [Arctia plantaginis]